MRLTVLWGHVLTFVIATTLALTVRSFFDEEGYISFYHLHMENQSFGNILAFISFGLYTRYCYVFIPPNHQGIQTCLGWQTGEVWGEGNFHFIPRPFWDIWKIVSVEHFTFTVAGQNRTKEGFMMMVFATGRAIPENAFLIAKMLSMDHLKEQLIGLAMMTIGKYINQNERRALLDYPVWDISSFLKHSLEEEREQHGVMELDGLYGVMVTLRTSKVIEVDKVTEAQFNTLARTSDMDTVIGNLRKQFPVLSDVELYAAYGAFVGINPTVMSYVLHGDGNKNIFVGGAGGHHN